MKTATVIAVLLAAVSSFPLIAKQQEPAQQPRQQSTPAATPAQQPDPNSSSTQLQAAPAAAAPATVELRPVKAELENKLDSKSAKAGDSVIVKTKESVKVADGTEIPKGSKLVGHVTNVLARGEGRENSQVAIQFDTAELKGGQSLSIESLIQSVEPAESGAGPGNAPAPYGGAQSSAPTGGGSTSGMSNSGMNSGNSNRANGTMANSPSQTAEGQSSSGPSMAGDSAPAAGKVITARGNVAIRTTAIPGVLLANSVNGQPFSNASGLLVGTKQDVKLEGGTQMTLAVAVAPAGHGSAPQGNGSTSPNQ